MFDISAVGAKILIKTGSGSKEITEFSDEGTPFECADVDVSTNQKNLNGTMISSRTPSVYSISITVIPRSEEDHFLTDLLQKAAIQPENVTPISDLIIHQIELSVPQIDKSGEAGSAATHTYTWRNGRIKSGPTGPSTSAEGRMSARTFTFEMEKFDAIG